MTQERTLAADSLGVGESLIMGVAGAAPAFSVSAATATLVAVVGTLAPASVLYCGICIFGITLAFIHLNKVSVNAGTSYAWVSQIFGRTLGFFAGWALLVASAVFMVSGSIPAATSTLILVAPHLANDPGWVTFIAAVWLTLVAIITFKGIKPASYVQLLMTGTELLVLMAIIIGGLIQFYHEPAHVFSWSWFSIGEFTPKLFATGALTSIFLYWGWDVTLNLNEETKNATHAPGRGAFGAVLMVILIFVSFIVVALLALTDPEIQHAGTGIVFTIADKIFPKPWGYLAILSVMLSTAGTLETSILQFTRTLFAVGRDKVLHPRYATLHKTTNSPWVAVMFIWMFGIILLLLSSNIPTVNLIIHDSVNAIGFQVAFYYSLTAFACAWYYRHLCKNIVEFIGYVIFPIASGLFLIFIALYSVSTFDWITNLIGIGGIIIGIVPYVVNRYQNH